jgi:hypothetical protein
MMTDIPRLRTPGVIAEELGAPLSRVLYVLRGHEIRPIGRAGCLRLYDATAVETVRAKRCLPLAGRHPLPRAARALPRQVSSTRMLFIRSKNSWRSSGGGRAPCAAQRMTAWSFGGRAGEAM